MLFRRFRIRIARLEKENIELQFQLGEAKLDSKILKDKNSLLERENKMLNVHIELLKTGKGYPRNDTDNLKCYADYLRKDNDKLEAEKLDLIGQVNKLKNEKMDLEVKLKDLTNRVESYENADESQYQEQENLKKTE